MSAAEPQAPPRVPAARVTRLGERSPRPEGRFVLYWMVGARRLDHNHALDRAIAWARSLARPLVVLEAIGSRYRWASDRLHGFVLDGMAHNRERAASAPLLYHPYVEPEARAGRGLIETLAREAAVVVTDDVPGFEPARVVEVARERLEGAFEKVDSCGLLPLRAACVVFGTARAFRRFLQKELPPHLHHFPEPDPLSGLELPLLRSLPPEVLRRWPAARGEDLTGPRALARLPIDHAVGRAPATGGTGAARARLERFLAHGLPRYAAERNHPDADAASGLSPWLHFGHLSVHEVFGALAGREGWVPGRLSGRTDGRRGWWGFSEPAEAFLDELVTWRELGLNMAARRPGSDRYETLPPWALRTLAAHAPDPRPHLYGHRELEEARTHDPVWNAAQRELVREGRLHNYLRMLWGKKILEWSPSPQEALERMVQWNNRYALDGRDANSVSGISWVLGRYDRPWYPERPIFGTVRYMSSQNTARKLRLKEYLRRHGEERSR